MTSFKLHLSAPTTFTSDEAAHSFYWAADSNSSILATVGRHGPRLGPNLGSLGRVADRNIDLVRIAVAVHCADRSVKRSGGGSNWNRRPLHLTIPVLDADAWNAVASDLKAVTDLLTGDDWSFDFTTEATAAEDVTMTTLTPKRVVLLSGGADSAIGALRSRSELNEDESHLLLSHFNSSQLAPLQRQIAGDIERLLPKGSQEHVQVHLGRVSKRIDGRSYRDETSNRSRSLLFLALGLAIASIHQVPLWIPENGFASLNPPLGPEHLGSLSTRTTHPAFLQDLSALIASVGGQSEIINPFAFDTKGEMFAQAAALVGRKEASAFLSATSSCSHTGQRNFGVPVSTACGVCFGCVVRRASFLASGLQDSTSYIAANGNADLQKWLDGKSIERSVARFVRRGIKARDVIAMGIPDSYSVDDVIALCDRGISELGALVS